MSIGKLPGMKTALIPTPHEPVTMDPAKYPAKYTPSELRVGDPVWYHGERHWIEWVPACWADSRVVRISDKKTDPRNPTPARTSFCVCPDTLELAPKSRAKRPPTKHAADQQVERKQKGLRDNGDPVAQFLRDAVTIDEVYKRTAVKLKRNEQELRAKYAHLNPGQQRMLCGNLLRAAHKKGTIS